MTKTASHLFLALLALVVSRPLAAQSQQPFRVMFYNVENLFDTHNNPRTNDDEFLPAGDRRWTPARYYTRLRQTARVINAIGEWGAPTLVGLCEVENDSVLNHLIRRTPLREQQYRYCITTGNDPRGINNALLYQRDRFRYIGHRSVRIRFTERNKRSRDILHVWGRVITGDTLDVFVCHFPSRSGGQRETEQSRIDAARRLRSLCDSLLRIRRTANIIAMGDFNDLPDNRSIRLVTQGERPAMALTNLFERPAALNFAGSHKHRGDWMLLDQMFVSERWLKRLVPNSPRIFNAPFLLVDDAPRQGKRPFRTYRGPRYEGGFSDHLPIVADFTVMPNR